ncbi:MAG: hypothetical protein ACE5LU_03875 [Anaerolineae bacterium]
MAGLFIAGFSARLFARLGRDAPDLFKMADPEYRRHTGELNPIPCRIRGPCRAFTHMAPLPIMGAFVWRELHRDPTQPVVIVGHSFGGAAAIGFADYLNDFAGRVAVVPGTRALMRLQLLRDRVGEPRFPPTIYVDLLVLIDSASRRRHPVVPMNVKRTVNLFATEPMPLWLDRLMARITFIPGAENIALNAAHGAVDRDGAATYAGHRSEPLQRPDALDWKPQYTGWDTWDFVGHFVRSLPDVGANAEIFA